MAKTPTESPLRKARKALEKTTVEVADAIGVFQSTISRLETGKQKASPELAEALANYLGNISEIEILYPERFVAQGRSGRAA